MKKDKIVLENSFTAVERQILDSSSKYQLLSLNEVVMMLPEKVSILEDLCTSTQQKIKQSIL